MTTLDALVSDTYSMLYGVAHVERPEEDTLVSAVSGAGDVSLQFATPQLWRRGDYAESQQTGELIVLAEDHGKASSVTVRRGQRSTVAAASYAAGDVFYHNPLFPRSVIEKAVNETVDNDLYPHVWAWGAGKLSWVDGDTAYPMGSDVADVTRVYQVDGSGIAPFPRAWWEMMHGVHADVEPGGSLLRLFRVHDSSADVLYTYRQRPSSADIPGTVSDTVANMVPWKAAAKLLAGHRVIPKSQAGGRSRSEGGDRPVRDYVFFDTEFRRMREDEKIRLRHAVRAQSKYRRGVRRG